MQSIDEYWLRRVDVYSPQQRLVLNFVLDAGQDGLMMSEIMIHLWPYRLPSGHKAVVSLLVTQVAAKINRMGWTLHKDGRHQKRVWIVKNG